MATSKPILPTISEVIQPALEKFYELRPKSFKHINLGEGTYANIFEGWKGQIALELSRIGKLVKANRVPLAEGVELAELLASEFHEEVDLNPTIGIGQVTFNRLTGTTGGVIPKGTRLIRNGSNLPPFSTKTSEYETVNDTVFTPGQLFAVTKIKAVNSGSQSSEPIALPYVSNHLGIVSAIFDTSITADDFDMSGGSDGADDAYMRLLAKTSSLGKYGPTNYSAALGALRNSGIRHYAGFLSSDDGSMYLFVADGAWASSLSQCNQIKQYLYDNELVGFGCKVNVLQVFNKVITVELTVIVRDGRYLDDPQSISDNIKKSVTSYFNDRDDWYVWKASGIRSSVIKCDKKVLNCSTVTVKDSDGSTITEPTIDDVVVDVEDTGTVVYHYYLPSNNIKINYVSPQ